MGLKIQILKDGDEFILILPDTICQELELKVGDTMVVNYQEEEGIYLRKVDIREVL